VPAEGRDDLELITEVDGKSYGGDKMLFLAFEAGKVQSISLSKPMDPKDLEE
jgi:hypothetical protein